MFQNSYKNILFLVIVFTILSIFGSTDSMDKIYKADSYYYKAKVQWNEELDSFNNPKYVIENLTLAIYHYPNEGVFYSDRASAYFQLGEHKKAIQDYNRAIIENPNSGVLYHNRGMFYLKIKDLNNSIKDAKKACSLGDCELDEFHAKHNFNIPLS